MLLKLLAAAVRLLIRIFPWLSADYRHRIRARQKCPACGAVKKHRMAFDQAQSKVLLNCVECGAYWGFDPIIKAAKWAAPEKKE